LQLLHLKIQIFRNLLDRFHHLLQKNLLLLQHHNQLNRDHDLLFMLSRETMGIMVEVAEEAHLIQRHRLERLHRQLELLRQVQRRVQLQLAYIK
jgi:hypothetical protein